MVSELNKQPFKKVLQIKKNEYLLEIRNNAVATTYNIEHAEDLSNWRIEQLSFIISNLKKVGYNKCKILNLDKDHKIIEKGE